MLWILILGHWERNHIYIYIHTYLFIYLSIYLFTYLCICQPDGNGVCLETSGDADSWPFLQKKRVPSPSEIRSSQDFSLWESVGVPPETCHSDHHPTAFSKERGLQSPIHGGMTIPTMVI